jgi:hypothetical protein
MKERRRQLSMQAENSGSSQNKRQEDAKKISDGESRVVPDTGGNEYTAAFILYCQKTLDNFRRIYASDTGSGFGSGSGLASSSTSSLRLGSEPENGKFELAQDYQSQSNGDEEEFEQMLKARAEFEDNELELDEEDKNEFDDYEEEALKELSNHFEQMLKEKAEFEDDELELEEDDEDEPNNHKEKEALEDFLEQFEQMLKDKDEHDNKLLKSEQIAGSQPKDYKEKEALKELLGQFEQIINNEAKHDNDDFALEQYDRSRSNGYKKEEGLKEFLEQSGQVQRTARGAEASYHVVGGPDAHGEEKTLPNVTEPSTPSHNHGPNDTEVDEALLGVGAVIKSAKENLGIVEAFWEESESERAELLAKAGITQEDFEQIVARTGSHLYDVKDCLEGWGDLSMLPETYEQLLLANNELSELFEKIYGKSTIKALNEKNQKAYEEDDDWELDDDDDDWELDDD